jgi:hypothetical protein
MATSPYENAAAAVIALDLGQGNLRENLQEWARDPAPATR